jgi:glycosyltransferase involved in cell wall biosynthesis
MKPLVSILIPAFNAQAWIGDAVRSALSQTWPNTEIIIVDDGSTDRTLTVAGEFASKKVSVVSQKNKGDVAARNRALALSQGDFIQWLDADDLISADKIERQVMASFEYPDPFTLFSSEWGYFAYRTGRASFSPTSLWCDLSPVEWLLRKMAQNLHMQTATWLVSRELTEAAGPWDTRLCNDSDGEYFCRVLLASNRVRFVPQARVFYRITPSSRVSFIGYSNEKKNARFLSMQLHVKYLQSLENSDRVRAACMAYLQNWLINFYPERPDIVEELEKLAASLGGKLEVPRLRWKYAWITPLFGLGLAKRAELFLPRLKVNLLRFWDRVMYSIEGRQYDAPSDSRTTRVLALRYCAVAQFKGKQR